VVRGHLYPLHLQGEGVCELRRVDVMKKVDKLHVVKAEGALARASSDGHESGFESSYLVGSCQ